MNTKNIMIFTCIMLLTSCSVVNQSSEKYGIQSDSVVEISESTTDTKIISPQMHLYTINPSLGEK